YRGPPTVPAMHARLRYPLSRPLDLEAIRVILNPTPAVDALMLIPAHRSIHAVAFGPALDKSQFCQALMVCARDGDLADGFELAESRQARLPFGAGACLTAKGQLAVGPAAF